MLELVHGCYVGLLARCWELGRLGMVAWRRLAMFRGRDDNLVVVLRHGLVGFMLGFLLHLSGRGLGYYFGRLVYEGIVTSVAFQG